MSYSFYKLLHLISIVTLFTSIGSIFAIYFLQNTISPLKKWMSILHGTSILLLFITGFGLLAKGNFMTQGMPTWFWIKLSVWIFLGILPIIIKKITKKLSWIFIITLLVAYGTIFLILYKPI